MERNQIFTIRPKLKAGESLLGYLIRVADENKISILELWQLINNPNGYKVDRNFSYKFDLFPSDIVHLNKLERLLNIGVVELKRHSFEPIVSLFYPGSAGKRVFGKEIEKRHRRFCSKCLEEEGVYQLSWQVKEIEICEKHLIRINTKCSKCGYHQPYINKNSLNHLQCDNCESKLYGEIDVPLQDPELIQKQLRIHRDWEFILGDLSAIGIPYLHNPQRIHNKIALLLLYLTTPQNSNLNSKKHPHYEPSQAKKLFRLARNKIDEKLSPSIILDTLRNLNIELREIFSQQVPLSFYKLLLKYKEKMKIEIHTTCSSPWCKLHGTINGIKDLKTSSKSVYLPKEYLYDKFYVCTNCWVQIGLRKDNKQWEEINISYSLIQKIKELLIKGIYLKHIALILKIDFYKLRFYLGYLARYQSVEVKKLENIKIDVETLIKHFTILKPYWRNNEKLARATRKLFGWNAITTYYYFWHPMVQEYIYLQQNQRKLNKTNYQYLVDKVDDTIENLIKDNIEISVKEVAATLNITEATLRYHKINEEIIYRKSTKLSLDKNEEKATIIENIAAFINVKRDNEQQIFAQEIYRSIGKNVKYMKKNFPDIAEQISKLAKESKIKQKEIRRRNLEKQVIEVYEEYGRIDMNLLSQNLGITVKTLKGNQGIYKGLRQFIRNVITDIE
ncbi:TniQ family protein [Ureibacillus sp. MALMAid1270]|uniref:TniQ family protein n=1 Tax=Ureibacillus sp. MALMAid1270 TaxID=3411629 RepID=UPI003BA45242